MHVSRKFSSFIVLLWASAAVAGSGTSSIVCDTNLTGPSSATMSVQTQVAQTPNVIDTIAAKIQISINHHGESVAKLIRPGQKLRGEHQGNGSAVIGSLKTQSDSISPTTLRVEERAVVPAASVGAFLENTETSVFLKEHNGGRPVVWKIRDEASAGFSLVNITVIGKYLTFDLDSGVQVGVKPRSRLYFETPNSDRFNTEKYRPSNVREGLGQLVAFELKFSSIQGVQDGGILSHQDSVFKPRFFYTTELDTRLRNITGRDPDYLAKLDAIKSEVLALQSGGRPLNNPQYIEENFEAIKNLISKDPDFLLPVVMVKNARKAYEAQTTEGIYQFTSDTDVEIFWASPQITASNILEYFKTEALYRGGNTENHVELKSPVGAVQGNLTIYNEMIGRIRAQHIPGYKIGAGKFALARYNLEKIGSQPIERTLLDFGTDFWLIKGTGQLSTLLKENEVTQGKRMVVITIPFQAKNGHHYRMSLTYQPASGDVAKATAEKPAILKDIVIRDRYDFKVELDQKIIPFILSILDGTEEKIVGLEIEGVVIPIKGKLTAAEHRAYIEFMRQFYRYDDFFRGGERDAGVLAVIQTPQDLPKVVRKIKKDNTVQFWRERLTKAYPLLIMSAIGGALAPHIPFQDMSNAVVEAVNHVSQQIQMAAPPAAPPASK